MYTFRVLGTVDLRGPDGNRVGSLLSQPKRLSLLALLAIESPRRLQRDEVMGRLWPEMSDERARNALRQALHYLRRSLGPGVVAGKGEEGIGLVPGKLECDAAQLLGAAAEGRFHEALDLYRGELLPGFHLDGAPAEFEHWLEDARRRVQRAAAHAAARVAEEEEARGNAVAAGAAARKAWKLGEWSEPALQELLKLLVRTGDTSGAREAYELFAERLRREHGAEPSVATREIVQELTTPASEWSAAPASAPNAAPVAAAVVGASPHERPAEPKPELTSELASGGVPVWIRGARPAAWWAGAAAVLVAVLVGGWLVGRPGHGVLEAREAVEGEPTLYLEPVRDLRADNAFPGLAEAVTTELAARLSETDGFRVVAFSPGTGTSAGEGVRLRSTLRDVQGKLQLSVLLLDPSSDAVLERLVATVEEDARMAPEVLSGRMAPRIRQEAGDVLSFQGLAKRGIHPDALSAVRAAGKEVKAGDGLRSRGASEAAALAYMASDSLLRDAAAMERGWAEPTIRRAEVSLHAVWLHLVPPQVSPRSAHQEILKGLVHAERGVAMAPEDARALEVRGVLRYWAAQTTDETQQKMSLRAAAERDLEEAVRRDQGLPQAWSILSALSEKRGDFAAAYHRARRAYVSDYDLRVPSDILARLFINGLESGDATGAAEWCREIRRQQPAHWLGAYCDLTHRAWVGPWVVAESDSLLKEGMRLLPRPGAGGELERRFELVHAVVLARAGEGAAARAVLARAADGGRSSLEVLDLRAWVRTALGDKERARELLAMASELNPEHANRVLRSRRYSDLAMYTLARNERR